MLRRGSELFFCECVGTSDSLADIEFCEMKLFVLLWPSLGKSFSRERESVCV